MTIFVTILIALGLALDAFAIAVTGGMLAKRTELVQSFRIAGFFGLFQAFMPVIGWAAGSVLEDYITGFDHWVAFALLSLVGTHMIYESLKPEHTQRAFDFFKIRILLLLALATSIDALAAGIGFAFMDVNIIRTVSIIGGVTFSLSFVGYRIGNRIGSVFGDKVRILGGIILIGIGLKTLIEHLR